MDPNLRVGDIALYWCENGVWHIQQAVAAAGTLTQGGGARETLAAALANAEAIAKALAVSTDGSGTAASERWMTAEDLAAAKAALADSSASALDLDRAVYELAVALDCAAQGTKA